MGDIGMDGEQGDNGEPGDPGLSVRKVILVTDMYMYILVLTDPTTHNMYMYIHAYVHTHTIGNEWNIRRQRNEGKTWPDWP